MTIHIQNLEIDKFRGIQQLKIDDLGEVNILVGDNNAGKTSVLEAIELLGNPSKTNIVRIARQRENRNFRMGLGLLDSFLYMFAVSNNKIYRDDYEICVGGSIHNKTGKITIQGLVVDQMVDMNEVSNQNSYAGFKVKESLMDGQEFVPTFLGKIHNGFSMLNDNEDLASLEINELSQVRTNLTDSPLVNVKFLNTIDHVIVNAFSELIRYKDNKTIAVNLLKIFDDSVVDIRYINEERKFIPVIERDNGDYIPLSLYGDGMRKALSIVNAIVKGRNGVVLIDEFETALHTTAMASVFKFMLEIAKKMEVQLFLTTHSSEAVDKLLQSAGEDLGSIRVVRLRKKDGISFAKTTIGNDAFRERIEYDMELRI